MGYHRKNKRRFDARYFLNERIEDKEQNIENSVQQEKLKSNNFSFDAFDSWNKEEIQESSCASGARNEDVELEEADCKPDYPDLNNNNDKEECISDAAKDKAAMKNEAVEDLEELQLGGEPRMTRDVNPMTPKEVGMAKAKERAKEARENAKKKGLGPVVDDEDEG